MSRHEEDLLIAILMFAAGYATALAVGAVRSSLRKLRLRIRRWYTGLDALAYPPRGAVREVRDTVHTVRQQLASPRTSPHAPTTKVIPADFFSAMQALGFKRDEIMRRATAVDPRASLAEQVRSALRVRA